jgi:hypothetical protein
LDSSRSEGTSDSSISGSFHTEKVIGP